MRIPGNNRLVPIMLLAALLLAAQSAALAHGYEHAPGSPQNPLCTDCVTANQLAAACVDTPAPAATSLCCSCLQSDQASSRDSAHTLTARQRAPPTPI
jgi:hypothetical protein